MERSILKLNFENDKQRADFVAWFSDAGGENSYWIFHDDREKPCPAADLKFVKGIVTEINFKEVDE